MSNHQLIFCTRKVKQTKFNKHNNVFLRSLKHYTVNVFVEKLQKVNFSNYEHFSCIDAAYTDFLNKLMKVVNEIAPSKEIRHSFYWKMKILKQATYIRYVVAKLLKFVQISMLTYSDSFYRGSFEN